ncbi:MAG TPA: Smr/MutS family protein [Caulobacteraceae bacterium]|nr:Smr/MutS family protein [Caulobacteraceae bacterium]
MKRPLRPEEVRLWAQVASTVRPAHGRAVPVPPPEPEPVAAPLKAPKATRPPPPGPMARRAPPKPPAAPDRIEPNRYRRIARDGEAMEQRLDLHGFTQDRARTALHGFIERAQANGARSVLIITGKGVQGDGILRRQVPEWLAEAPSRSRVAGVSFADRRHGGEGALYVALKRLGKS